jgi:large subunit ribosomal protein L35
LIIRVLHYPGVAYRPSGRPFYYHERGSFFTCSLKEEKMPKMKTNRGAAKRFKTTGTGKIVRSKAFGNHILTKKTTKRKRRIRQSSLVDGANMKNVKKLIPYL